MAEIDGQEFVSLRADEVLPGDLVHNDGQVCVAWGVERVGDSQVTLYFSTTADQPWRDLGERTTWNSNPVWVGAYDARVTGRSER